MFIQRGSNDVVFLTDVRLKSDREYELENSAPSVMRFWSQRGLIDQKRWRETTKIALFDHGAKPFEPPPHLGRKEALAWRTAKREAVRDELRELYTKLKPSLTFVLPSRSTKIRQRDEDAGETAGYTGTFCWDAVSDYPMNDVIGTINKGVIALYNPLNMEFVFSALNLRWMLAAYAWDQGQYSILEMPGFDSELCHSSLSQLVTAPWLAVDIESYSPLNLITRIGISDGTTTVSVPWDEYRPLGATDPVPDAGVWIRQQVAALLASRQPKVFHNFAYDVPFLARKGYPTNGTIHDTYILHGLAYRQFPHGLQRATSHEFLIPAWKTEHQTEVRVRSGLVTSNPDAWISNPDSLPLYNARDTFYTAHLFRALVRKTGIVI